jgi:hypothetical protein
MRFAAEHRFAAPVDAVIAGLTDPEFHRGLQLPDLKLLDVDVQPDQSETVLRLRYDFVGHLDPLARRLLGGRQLTWLQELRLDGSGTGRLTFDGELVVEVPVVGHNAERRIVPGLLRRLDIEAAALDQHHRSA